MKNILLGFACFTGLMFSACNNKQDVGREILYADPTVYVDNGIFYLTGTRNIEPLGFCMLQSDNLKDWYEVKHDETGLILNGNNQSAFGTMGFWAPQIINEDGHYYITYTANEQICLADAHTLTGPFVQNELMPIDESEKNIDSFLFKDDDGKYYLYHVRFNRGNYLWVAEFDFENRAIKNETLQQCFAVTQDWEDTPNYESDPIMEGPTVLKIDSKYYLIYSANHFMNIDYAVGYAVSDSPYGPWEKSENNPIIHRDLVGENGSGHGDIFFGDDNQAYYVYHVHNSQEQVVPRKTRIVPMNFVYNDSKGIYDISINTDEVIKPVFYQSNQI